MRKSEAAAFSVHGLVKSFGDVRALDGVDLEAQPGTVLGVLGPAGAGKTTLARVLAGRLAPDAGSARVAGLDVVAEAAALRARVGFDITGPVAPVLVLDEPTAGLDPRSRRHVWDVIDEFAARGTTVLLTTRSAEEAERLTDRTVLLERGRM